MRFTVVTYGTEGDTRPLVGLSRGLMEAGHEVRLFADPSTIRFAGENGVQAGSLDGDMRGAVYSGAELAGLIETGGGVRRMAGAVAEIANKHATSWMRTVVEDATVSSAILFSGIASYIGLSAAEHLEIPAIGLGLWPISPTTEFASPLLPPWPMPGPLNLLSHRAVNALLWRRFRGALNDARREICGKPGRKRMWGRYPVLYGISPSLVPQPIDWPPEWRICGAWYVSDPEWTPPSDLVRYLGKGPPPIYVGFGSMAGFDKRKLLAAVIGAVAGRRALFYPGWSGIDRSELPGNFFVVGDTPHDWLLPKTSTVIHHGGAGTSHSAARAGVPSIVVPFAGDQFFWAGRLHAVGVAPRYVPHTKITAGALAKMIEFTERPEVQVRGRRLGEAIRQENGIDEAVTRIGRHIAGKAPQRTRRTAIDFAREKSKIGACPRRR